MMVGVGRYVAVLVAVGFGVAAGVDLVQERDTNARVAEALELARHNKLEQAREIAEDVLQQHPDHAGAMGVMGHVVYDREDRGPARIFAQRCALLDPDNADCWWQVSVHARFDDERALAEEAGDCYLALEPEGDYAEHIDWSNRFDGHEARPAGACARASRALRSQP